MAKNTARSAATMTIDQAYEIVNAHERAKCAERMDRLQAKAKAIAESPTTRKVGIAALGAGVGAGLYALLAS